MGNPFVNYNKDLEATSDGESEALAHEESISDFERAVLVRDESEWDMKVQFRRLGILPKIRESGFLDGLDLEFSVELALARGRSFNFALGEIKRFLERAKVKTL